MKKIHFIGIGGIGVSALARYSLAQGDKVSGSDCASNPILEELEKLGIQIFLGHKAENIFHDLDLVIYSAAVQQDNPEIIEARRLGIKCQKYAEALGELTKEKFTIAVSGMHGKSTTTAMIGLIMERAGLDPTVIVGAKVSEWGNVNFRLGKSKYLLIEADEYDRSFLNYWPKIIVLLNIEKEHLDTYVGGLKDIIDTFRKYILHLPSGGVLVINEEDKKIKKIFNFKFLILNKKIKQKFKIEKYRTEKRANLKLKIPGQHNLSNANAALKVAEVLGIEEKIALSVLNDFNGIWRRMEYKGEINGAKIYDDYGHHPTEIKLTLEGARQFLVDNQFFQGRLWCVFQPHQYQRTYDLFNDFIKAFDSADRVILLPIYSVAGREDEEVKKKVSSEKLVQALKEKYKEEEKIKYCKDFDEAIEYLKVNLKNGDICLIMGAGDVYKLTERLLVKK